MARALQERFDTSRRATPRPSGPTVVSMVDRIIRWLEQPLQSPPYRGHSRWHTLCPSFHLWKSTNPWSRRVNERVSDYWQRRLTVEKGFNALERKYRTSVFGGLKTYQRIADVLAEHACSSVLDIGCGDGVFLRYVVERGDLPLESLWGCELDPKRVRNAHRQLYMADVERCLRPVRDPAAVHERRELNDLELLARAQAQVVQFDLMGDDAWPKPIRADGIEAMTLIALTTSFNDTEMQRLAAKLVELAPRVIIDASLYENIQEGYGGRMGVERFFAPHGYRQTLFEWVPERLTGRSPTFFWRRRAYWPSVTLSVLERAEG